nr:unnamed protein product [Haemonchus contortus]
MDADADLKMPMTSILASSISSKCKAFENDYCGRNSGPKQRDEMLISVLRYCTKAAMFTGISRKPVACFVKISYSTMVLKPVHPDEQKFVDTALQLVKEAGRVPGRLSS